MFIPFRFSFTNKGKLCEEQATIYPYSLFFFHTTCNFLSDAILDLFQWYPRIRRIEFCNHQP